MTTLLANSSVQESESYIYTKLADDKNIRLLELLSVDQFTIWTSLKEVPLKDAEQLGYEALSYAWGPPNFSEKIFVDGAQLSLTPSLFGALKSMAKLQRRYVWADAVCINQIDLLEKAIQIPMMTDIYRLASRVIVWLGEETENLRVAFLQIPKFLDRWRPLLSTQRSWLETCIWMERSMENYHQIEALTELFDLDWFERLWTLQEVVVARSVVFSCSSLILPYEVLASFVSTTATTGVWNSFIKTKSAKNNMAHFDALNSIRLAYQGHVKGTPGKFDFLALIVQTRSRECSDPRDSLFALGGLANSRDTLPYPADYEKGVVQVYTDFTVHNIFQTNALRVVSLCKLEPQSAQRTVGLPSWVPDWNRKLQRPFSWHSDLSHIQFTCCCPSPAKAPTWSYDPINTPKVLSVRIHIVEKLQIVWRLPHLQEHDDNEIREFLSMSDIVPIDVQIGLILEELLLFCGPYSAHSIPWDVLWRVLVFDSISTDTQSSRALPNDRLLVEAALNFILCVWQCCQLRKRVDPRNFILSEYDVVELFYGIPLYTFRGKPYATGVKGLMSLEVGEHSRQQSMMGRVKSHRAVGLLRRVFGHHIVSDKDLTKALQVHGSICAEFMIRWHNLFTGRAFCFTESGKPGWVPEVAIEGDLVCLIPGQTVPMILRPCDDENGSSGKSGTSIRASYQVVGEAYIHGIMDGEAVEGKGEDVFEWVDLV